MSYFLWKTKTSRKHNSKCHADLKNLKSFFVYLIKICSQQSIIYEVYSVLTSRYIICSNISLSKCRNVVRLILVMLFDLFNLCKLFDKPQFV